MDPIKAQVVLDNELNKRIEEFKKTYPNTRLWILTPCFGSQCYVGYVSSLIKTIEYFRQIGIALCVEFCRNDSLVTRARNNTVARAYSDPNMTHVIFIDNDIIWTPNDVIKLLLHDKDVIGGIYPIKKYYWDRLIQDSNNPYNSNPVKTMLLNKEQSVLNSIVSDEEFIQHSLLRYNLNYMNETIKVENSLCEVKHLPTGFLCIKRGVFEKMFKAFPSTKYVDDVCYLTSEESNYAYSLFDCGVEMGSDGNPHYLSEDWMFCSRWSKMGGRMFAECSVKLTHTGVEDYNGFFLSSLLNK